MSKLFLAIALTCWVGACATHSGSPIARDDAGSTGDDAAAAGGVVGSGGAVGSGGVVASGGLPGSGGRADGAGGGGGGATATGATSSSGGATGGRPASGGIMGTGGSTGVAGANGTGGRTGAAGANGTGGRTAAGGASGSTGSGGASGRGGATGGGGATSTGNPSCSTTLPAANGKITVSSTVQVSGTKDYDMQQVCADPNTLGPGDQSEDQKAVFMLAANAVLKNVIIGGSGCSAADGVHCESGSCTLENVWFGDVGEDAITFKGSGTSQVMTITGGGAFSATDKVIQHNGPGTIKVSGFYVNNAGKLYRSCGNCSSQYTRHVVLDSITAKSAKTLVGINTNYNDTATLTHITLCGSGTTVCQKYTGNNTGAEPTSSGSGPDSTNCLYSNADITTQ
jgi:pectate lyase